MNAAKQLVATLAVALSAACAGNAPGDGPAPARNTTVEVTNNNWSDMVVYALRNGVRYRLGTVTSMRTERLEVPGEVSRVDGEVELLADPIGSSEVFSTGQILVRPGQQITLQLQNYLPISTVAVASR